MDLVRAAPFDVRDYRLDFRTVPAVVKPGQAAKLLFRIFHPGSGDPIKKFEVVHDGLAEPAPPVIECASS